MIWERVGRMLFPEAPEPACLRDGAPMEGLDLLVPLLDELAGRFGARAAERLRELVARMGMMERVRVDESLRRRVSTYYGGRTMSWVRGPDDVRRLPLPAGTEGVVLGLLAGLPSGYVREAAVQRLALLGDGTELPPLLVRANDWVDPVRIRALDALRVRLVAGYAAHWVAALPLVLRLRSTGRADARPLVDAVLALLRAPESRNAVWRGMHAADRTVRRASFRILMEADPQGLAEQVDVALRSRDEMIRLEAARAAPRLDDRVLDELLPRLMADDFSRVRMAVLPLAAQRAGAAALPLLRGALLDRAARIRAEARTALARLEPMDFAAFYRARVGADAPRLAEAVAGLSETGTREDADAVAPLLAHARPGVRAAALRALARLAGDASVPALTAALGDGSPRVSRAARDALRPRVRTADAGALEAWFRGDHPSHVRLNALSLLAARGKWTGLVSILQGCDDVDPRMHEAARSLLLRWRQHFNRTFTQPTPAQQADVRAALDRAAWALDAETMKWLRFATGTA